MKVEQNTAPSAYIPNLPERKDVGKVNPDGFQGNNLTLDDLRIDAPIREATCELDRIGLVRQLQEKNLKGDAPKRLNNFYNSFKQNEKK